MKTLVLLFLTLLSISAAAQTIPSPDEQIAASVLALPEELRAGAGVLGYGEDGKLKELRKGTGEMICLASDPKAARFSASCYHKDLEPYMARGRELTAQGITGNARNEQYRWKEIKEGKLKMPKEPRMLYVLSGKNYDVASGKVVEGLVRWVIYVPYATAESTGLSTKSKRGEPWLMDAGTPGAHIMMTPVAPPPTK